MSRTLAFYSLFVIDGSAEFPFINLTGWACSAGLLFRHGKSRQKRAGETPAPSFCPIGQYQGRYPVATEFPLGRWPLVIGAVLHELRLTALGMRVVSFLGEGKPECFP